jgi:ATP/maltotriose-dependent transcriptional regulator MalT
MIATFMLVSLTSNVSTHKKTIPSDTLALLVSQYHLTARETEVLILLAKGYSRPYIGNELVISLSTVKTHVENIYAKLGINKRDSLLEMITSADMKADASASSKSNDG